MVPMVFARALKHFPTKRMWAPSVRPSYYRVQMAAAWAGLGQWLGKSLIPRWLHAT